MSTTPPRFSEGGSPANQRLMDAAFALIQRSLESIKGDAQNEQARYRTQIDSAENELWSLTGAASPDPAAIEHKTHEIEALRHDQRIAYIHAVGLAAEVLTDTQRKQLTGIEPPMPTSIKGK